MSNSLLSTSHYLPEHEVLLVSIDMSDYLIDYYLHRKDYAAKTLPEHDENLKALIACFSIHLTLRPATETHAWTVHQVSHEPYSLFVTGSAGELDSSGDTKGFLIGHVLTENIRHTDVNSFHAQFTDQKRNTSRSYVRCESPEVPRMVEFFYEQSEQLPLRLLLSDSSDRAYGLAAIPGYDKEWFRSVSLEDLVQSIGPDKKQMRKNRFEFLCDCSPEKLLPFFRSMPEDSLDELYGTETKLIISCPRCGKQFSIARDEISPLE